MDQYEIRIRHIDGTLGLILAGCQPSDVAAIQSARKLAHGHKFEVWKGKKCITGLAALPPLQALNDTRS